MKLGIVGTGTIVEEVLPVLQQVKGLSCYGICGTKRSEAKAEKLKEQYQMQLAVSDYEKLLDSEIDTVYIAVPNLLHFEMAKEAVLRGKHVIVEKPMKDRQRSFVPLQRSREYFYLKLLPHGISRTISLSKSSYRRLAKLKWQSAISANIPENMTVSRMEKTFLFLMQSRQVEL